MAKLSLLFLLVFVATAARANMEGETWVFHANDGNDYSFPRKGSVRGSPLVSLREVVKEVPGLDLAVYGKGQSFRLRHLSSGRIATFKAASKTVAASHGPVALSRKALLVKDDLQLPIDFGDRVLRPLLTGEAAPKMPVAPSGLVDVVVDPGHGGNDWGASVVLTDGTRLREKDLTLALSQELVKKLEAAGLKVALTRNEDMFLTLPERTLFANHAKARFFLSLHLNADPAKKASGRGYEVYLLSLKADDAAARASVAVENQAIPEDLSEGVEKALGDLRAEANFEASLEWAKKISGAIKGESPAFGKPVKAGPFYVLYGTAMPALLVEAGFLTHPVDRARLADAASRDKLLTHLSEALASELKSGKVRNP